MKHLVCLLFVSIVYQILVSDGVHCKPGVRKKRSDESTRDETRIVNLAQLMQETEETEWLYPDYHFRKKSFDDDPYDKNFTCSERFTTDQIVRGKIGPHFHPHPWMVLLIAVTSRGQFACSGFLITTQWILTAAHCLALDLWYIAALVGLDSTYMWGPENAHYIFPNNMYPNHKFYNTYIYYDIALLKLPEELIRSPLIKPICLPIEAGDDPNTGEILKATGWRLSKTSEHDLPNDLQIVNVEIKPCTFSGWICTAVTRSAGTQQDSCLSDTGGPLIRKVNGTSIVVGILSMNRNPCEAMYTRITEYHKWIKDLLKRLS